MINKLLHKQMLVEVEKIQEHTGRPPKDSINYSNVNIINETLVILTAKVIGIKDNEK